MATELTSLCVRCRTPLGTDEDCDVCGDGQVVSLREVAERAGAVAAAIKEIVVPPSDEPNFALRSLYLVGLLLTFVATFLGIGIALLLGGPDAAVIAAPVGAALSALMLFGPLLLEQQRGREYQPKGVVITAPVGSEIEPKPPKDRWLSGVVRGAGDDEPCAELLELTAGDKRQVTLRDGHSRGFFIELDDGRRMRIPEGRIRIDARRKELRPAPRREVNQRLRILDPLQASHEGHPFPYDQARRLRIADGERVEVAARFRESWDDEAGYREQSEPLLTVEGVPWLKRA